MNRIRINEAEAIFEPFWDSGESYPCKRKYSVLEQYRVTLAPQAAATVEKNWCCVTASVEQGQGLQTPACILERDCSLEIDGYDRMLINTSASENVRVTVDCEIDGEQCRVLDFFGNNKNHEESAPLRGKQITKLKISVFCSGRGAVYLYWLGLQNERKLAEMLSRSSGFSEEWEGCFEEHPRSLSPRIGMLFDAQELETIREKIGREPFAGYYRETKRIVQDAMEHLVPEQRIGRFVPCTDGRWKRERDVCEIHPGTLMQMVALVGSVEQDERVMRYACRLALSVSCDEYWCEGFMGAFPATTWHHRSFTEEWIIKGVGVVLDLCGHLLTWHGRNILHNAIALKGLPRLEADYHMMEYIHHMNQGIAFSSGYLVGLIALAYDYPRYRRRICEAEEDLLAALDRYVYPDGGTIEGPSYWVYSISTGLLSLFLLAKYKKQPYPDTLPDSIRRTMNYGLSFLSTTGNGDCTLPINDSGFGRISPLISATFSLMGDHRSEWQRLLYDSLEKNKHFQHLFMDLLLIEEVGKPTEAPREGFYNHTEIGQISLLRQSEECGTVRIHAIAGPNLFSHCHSDNGSFLLEAGGETMIGDFGKAVYGSATQANCAWIHNLFFPIDPNGASYDQLSRGGARVCESVYEDGVWYFTGDLLGTWDKGIYRRTYRRIFSPDPQLYLILDEAEYESPHASAFNFCAYETVEPIEGGVRITGKNAQATVLPVNWSGEYDSQSCGQLLIPTEGDYAERSVTRVSLQAPCAPFHRVITLIEVSVPGRACAEICGDEIRCGDKRITARAEENGFYIGYGGIGYRAEGEFWKKGEER